MAEMILTGKVISSGVAKGILCFMDLKLSVSAGKKKMFQGDISKEISRFNKEVEAVINELRESIKMLKKDSYHEEAEIIQTHTFMLEDKEFKRRVYENIKTNRFTADVALRHVVQEMVGILENSENTLVAEHAADLIDIEMRLRKRLTKEDDAVSFYEHLDGVKDPVMAIKELLPSLVLEAKSRGVRALIVRDGTQFSHAAILAKAFGMAVLKIENFYNSGIKNNDTVLVDAINGRLLINPAKEEIENISKAAQKEEAGIDKKHLPVKLWINITDPLQIKGKDLKGLEGIGLYRTEFLFMKERENFPDEEEQFSVYSFLFKRCKDSVLTIKDNRYWRRQSFTLFFFRSTEKSLFRV